MRGGRQRSNGPESTRHTYGQLACTRGWGGMPTRLYFRRLSSSPLPPVARRSSRRRRPPADRLQLARRALSSSTRANSMGEEVSVPPRKFATCRICEVSGFSTELIELHSEEPLLHIIFIPGNPGVVAFYKRFIEAIYENFEGRVSITGIGHVSHTKKTCTNGRTFSLQDQIDHKVDFINQELQDAKVPVVMVGHSIGSYICLEILKASPLLGVKFTVALYPFLTLNNDSLKQYLIGLISRSLILSTTVSSLSHSLGLLPEWIRNLLVRRSLGPSWTSAAVEVISTDLLQYQTMRSILFMALTEFEKLSEEPDWSFIRSKQDQMALLFGVDDHWGPLTLLEEISRQAPDVHLAVEREGHTHAFCCTDAGSVWVACHVVSLLKSHVLSPLEI